MVPSLAHFNSVELKSNHNLESGVFSHNPNYFKSDIFSFWFNMDWFYDMESVHIERKISDAIMLELFNN